MKINLSNIDSSNFEEIALQVFDYQYGSVKIYCQYCDKILGKKTVKTILDIPFLPISFFKSHKVLIESSQSDFFFESSGTTSTKNSRHYIHNIELYLESIKLSFYHNQFNQYDEIIGLLPHYMEREHSSLAYMVKEWMQLNHQEEQFYLYNHNELYLKLLKSISEGKKVLLFGISFGLLDFADKYIVKSDSIDIIETGGMKGRRAEMIKTELIESIQKSFPKSKIISEYGMCELLSQSYSDENLVFKTPEWEKVYVGDIDNPLSIKKEGRGKGKIIDLANIHSCSFIQTDDLIELKPNGSFQILGRVDSTDIRGCSLMY